MSRQSKNSRNLAQARRWSIIRKIKGERKGKVYPNSKKQ